MLWTKCCASFTLQRSLETAPSKHAAQERSFVSGGEGSIAPVRKTSAVGPIPVSRLARSLLSEAAIRAYHLRRSSASAVFRKVQAKLSQACLS